jgi:hypothetical protein
VSTGFVARALARFAQCLAGAGFDEAMKAALRAEDVLCADETPTNVIHKDTDEQGEPVPGSPHAVTVRTPDARLVWYAPIGSRSKTALVGLGVLEGYAGYLVRDDYAGWHQFDAQLAGVGQCAAHLIRHAKGVLECHPTQQQWAGQVITVLCEAAAAVTAARADGRDHLDPQLLAELRRRYDEAVSWGIATNRHRDWPKGNHPGYNLATRLRDKAEQVWTFTRNLAVPWTNNASEQALKGPKRHQAVSGYWHTLSTLAAYCRVRFYLVSARGHNVRAIDAIHNALTGNPWLRPHLQPRDTTAHPPGSRRGSHPPAPTDPYVSLSAYTAPAILITRSAGPKEPISNARTCEDTFQWPLANTSWLSSWSAAVCISCESSAPSRR